MRVAQVQIGREYFAVLDRSRAPVMVRVVGEEPHTTFSASGSRTQRGFRLVRVDTGAALPELRTAHALRAADDATARCASCGLIAEPCLGWARADGAWCCPGCQDERGAA